MQLHITLDVPAWFEGDADEGLKRAVIAHVGKLVVDRIGEKVQGQIVNDAIAAAKTQVDSVVAELLLMPVQKTNAYGEPKGPAKTVRELIIEGGQGWLAEKVSRNGNPDRHGDQSRIEWLARTVASDAVDKELRSKIDAAIAEIRGTVKVRARDLIADAVAKILEQRG